MATGGGGGPARPVHRVFAEVASASPDAVAIVCGDRRLSYAALDREADRLAGRLHKLGVGQGSRVALLLARSIEAITAMLAVLKVGGAFVPLDPAYPAAQLADIVADCDPACVLAEAGLLAELGPVPPWRARTLLLAEALGSADAPAPTVEVGVGNPAYIMYTSGSTGRPKGVVVPHRAILRLVIGADYVRLGADEVILQLAPLAFDASTFEIWGALLNGGRLAVMPSVRPTLEEIAAAIARHQVTTLWLTAGLFHLLVDHRLEALRPLRQLVAGGDVLSPVHVAKVLNALPGCRLINGYGPTENTTFTCCHTITAADLAGDSVPIGRAISGTTVHVLDPAMQPVRQGGEGQLCAGGSGVALGYLNRPELTAERFVPDPFSSQPEARLYLTGDLVRQRADGALMFLGRIDRQVKIDGHRVEFDEIEAALRRQPGVRDAVAVLREDAPGRKRIVAYVVGGGGGLASVLRASLPPWAMPGAIVSLPALPLNANGKVDRARLPAPETSPSLAPRTDKERALAAIWQRVLGLPTVGRGDNFFDLGGTSLQLIEVHAEIARELKPDIALIDLFRRPRISELAALLLEQPTPLPAAIGAAERARRAAEAMRRARTGQGA